MLKILFRMLSDSDDPVINNSEERGKKRKSTPSAWKRNVQKTARCKGEEYITSKGNLVPAKTPGLPCG